MNATQNDPKRPSCLVCGRKFASSRELKRGLCPADYERFRRSRAKAKASGLANDEFESGLIAKGLLLPDAREASDPFIDAINEMVAAKAGRLDPDGADPELLDTLNKEAEKFQRSRSAKKPAKKAPRKRSQG